MRRYSLASDALLWEGSEQLKHSFSSTVSPGRTKGFIKSRRHSNSLGSMHPLVSDPEFSQRKSYSRRSTGSSNATISSFGTYEYSSMFDSWGGDGWGEFEDQLMRLSGNDFKTCALAPSSPDKVASEPDENCAPLTMDKDTFDDEQDVNAPPSPLNWPSDRLINSVDSPSRARQLCEAKGSSSPNKTIRDRPRKNSRRLSSLSLDSLAAWPEFSDGGALGLEHARRTLDYPGFSALAHSDDDLALLAAEIFFELGLEAQLGVPRAAVQTLVLSVRARMLDNPYHNWAHVVDVTQMVFYLARRAGTLAALSPVQQLALYVAALCHDLEHPGVSAGYLLRSKSALAACYREDPGLLEKHHSLRALELIICKDIKLLETLTDGQKREVGSLARQIIMATDMRLHSTFLGAVSEAGATSFDGPAGYSQPAGCGGGDDDSSPELRIMQLLLKCADISNVLKPFDDAAEWAVRITDEFFSQGDLERAGGLEISPMCDRFTDSRTFVQRNFIDHLAGPFLRAVARERLPSVLPLLAQMETNRQRWDSMTDDALLSFVRPRERARPWASQALSRSGSAT